MHKYYVDKIIKSNNIEKCEKLGDLFIETIDILKEHSLEDYEYVENSLYEICEGRVLNEERAQSIIDNMKPMGMKWSFEETENVRRQYALDDIRPVDFWIVMNMTANDYAELFKEDLDMYVNYSKMFIQDEDAEPDKVYTYFTIIPRK